MIHMFINFLIIAMFIGFLIIAIVYYYIITITSADSGNPWNSRLVWAPPYYDLEPERRSKETAVHRSGVSEQSPYNVFRRAN